MAGNVGLAGTGAGGGVMSDAGRYVKIVEWSEEDGVFVGQCPGVIGPCCHGPDEAEVYRQLCQIVEDWIALLQQQGRPLPSWAFEPKTTRQTG
jgi:predicted RNase H-like HicB family nuclease